MGFKFNGIKRTWTDTKTTGDSLQSYTTTTTSGEPIEIAARQTTDPVIINGPITHSPYTAPAPTKDGMDVGPTQYGWICPRCGRVNSPLTTSCDCQKFIVRTIEREPGIPPACINCSNHPSNGGSGICHCILGSPKIIC